jgi:flagellar motor component MotA
MKDKLIGLVFLLVLCVGVVVYVTCEDGISLLHFVSLPSFVFVAGFGGGLTYMRKNKYKDNELITIHKNNLIRGGWIGFIVGMILNLASSDGMNSIGPGMAAAAVTILYGYTSGYLTEALLEK